MSSSPAGTNQDAGEKVVYWGGEEVHTTLKHQSSEVSTSGDELVKVRKPYTITKQRERWTEEEHQKFLEALKLYGRAWRRIEEHIGTKTAVQIRSHAQKFFSKLEREQAAGGVHARTVQDIDIPPPRPKRKPSHPYPRKANVTAFEGAMASPAALPSSVSDLLVRPSVEPTSDMGKVLERCKSELKLFGQTVVVPSVTRAVAPVFEARELSSENNQKDADLHEKLGTCHQPVPGEKDQHPGVDLSALYYSKFWERVAETTYPFNHGLDGANLWQFGYHHRPSATCWPNFSAASLNEITASVMRAIMTGAAPDAERTENTSAALAAATVAAASAWWALQGSVPPSFHAQRAAVTPEAAGVPAERQAPEPEKMVVEDGELGNETLSPSKNVKRVNHSFEGQDGVRKRPRLRCFVGSNEKQVSEVLKCSPPPPSSSGSYDGIAHTERTEQLNGDGDASGNSGPSSNSSHCGSAEAAAKSDESSTDKEPTEEEVVLEEASKALKNSTNFSHHCPLMYSRTRKGQRVARPSRSSGSDGEQRKEVSQEGRMAFQALFSHQKLPQTFSLRGGEVYSKKPASDLQFYINNNNNGYSSLNETASSLRISGPECFDSDSSPMLSKPSGDEESFQPAKSGFVPYRRAAEAAASVAAGVVIPSRSSCKAEEVKNIVAGRRLMDEEVK